MPIDITITPLYRVDGQDQLSLPGLMAAVPPRRAARSRDQDRLIVHLVLAGKAVLSSSECINAASRAAVTFYATPGGMTSALRAAAGSINRFLHDRNLSSPAPGQYAVGILALAAVREAQLTLLLSGPAHAFVLGVDGARHVFDGLSGRGLGLSETMPHYFSQIPLHFSDRLVLCGNPPSTWEAALHDASPASLDATRRRLMSTLTSDVNAVLMQFTEGAGLLTMQRPSPADKTVGLAPAPPQEEYPGALGEVRDVAEAVPDALTAGPGRSDEMQTALQAPSVEGEGPHPPVADFSGPSAYAIPPESHVEHGVAEARVETGVAPQIQGAREAAPTSEPTARLRRARREERTRQAAKTVAGAIRSSHRARDYVLEFVRKYIPRLLPASNQNPFSFSSPAMMFIAVLIPLVVVTVASAVYFRYGRSVQYEQYLVQAQEARSQALSLADAVAQREALQRELFYLDKADGYTETDDTRSLRTEAQQDLDQLQGIVRLQFQPVLSSGVGAQIGRLAATENDLYLLDAARGAVLHAALLTGGFQVDRSFNCAPGTYGGFTVGPVVDILAMPAINTINASVIGVDAAGNLLYCAPGQVAQAIPLPPPDTNWGRVKAMTMDAGNLYVLDSQAHAVWVYVGKDGAFVDRPYFFFGGQIPELDDAIDLAVNADDLYVLHSDGRLSTCFYSRIEAVPTRCVDPAPLVNPLPAYGDVNLFSEAHFTQMLFTPAPDSALMLLDSDNQGVFRFSPRSLELQSQLRSLAGRQNPLPQGQVTAMAVSPNHVLYFALQDRIYFASDIP